MVLTNVRFEVYSLSIWPIFDWSFTPEAKMRYQRSDSTKLVFWKVRRSEGNDDTVLLYEDGLSPPLFNRHADFLSKRIQIIGSVSLWNRSDKNNWLGQIVTSLTKVTSRWNCSDKNLPKNSPSKHSLRLIFLSVLQSGKKLYLVETELPNISERGKQGYKDKKSPKNGPP